MPARLPRTRLISGLIGSVVLALPLSAAAAEVTITDPELRDTAGLLSGSCSLKLKGPLAPGDAGRLEAALEEETIAAHRSQSLDLHFGTMVFGHVLCLNSTGGDEAEALALAEVISGRGLVTAVPDGASCIGPCAVAFMAGSALSSNSDGGARMPMRVLHTGGRLGFHAPALTDGDAVLDYIVGLTGAFSGIDSYTPTARFHPQLLIEMLSHRAPASPYLIDTAGKAGLYDIRLAGVPQIETDEAAWMRACNNLSLQAKAWQLPTDPDLSSWDWRVTLPEEGYTPEARQPPEGLLSEEAPTEGAPAFFREVLSRHHQCLFFHDGEATPPYAAWFERVSEDSQPQLRLFDLWQTLPHYTPLTALRGMERVEPADFRSLYASPPTAGPHADMPAITGIRPGQSLVTRGPDDLTDVTDAQDVAFWFGPEGEARIYPAGEAAQAARYRIEGDTLCLTPVAETAAEATELCGGFASAEDGTALTLGEARYPVLFLRPGDIGPLPGG